MKFNYNFIRMHANMTDICKFGKMFEFTYTTPPSRKKSQQINDYRYINLLLSNVNKKLQIQKRSFTTQKMKLSIMDFLGDQSRRKLWIWSHLLKKFLTLIRLGFLR